MGVSLSTAKWLAPLSFAVDFAAQNYGMLSSPNMKDVHDANLSFWSPQPFFIAGFFFPQQLFQLAWLWRLYKADVSVEPMDADIGTMIDFAPFYAIGNLCIASKYNLLKSLPWRIVNTVRKLTSRDSLDDILEQLEPQNCEYLCHHQQSYPTLLHLQASSADEHKVDQLGSHSCSCEDVCRHRSLGSSAQHFGRLFRPPAAVHYVEGTYWRGLRAVGQC